VRCRFSIPKHRRFDLLKMALRRSEPRRLGRSFRGFKVEGDRWPSVAPNLADSGGALEGSRSLARDGLYEGVDKDSGK